MQLFEQIIKESSKWLTNKVNSEFEKTPTLYTTI